MRRLLILSLFLCAADDCSLIRWPKDGSEIEPRTELVANSTDNTLAWESDRQGPLGTGARVQVQLEPGDHVITVTGGDEVHVRVVDPQRRLQSALVDAVMELVDESGRPRFEFTLMRDRYYNTGFFRDNGLSFRLHAGVRPSAAIRDIVENPHLYGFECATAITVIQYRALHTVLGDEEFDRRFPYLMIGQLDAVGPALRALKQTVHAEPLQVGDHTWFHNPDVSDAGRRGGWGAENVIYLGDDRYFGHPFGVSAAGPIIDHLNRHRNPDLSNPRSARLDSIRYRLIAGRLQD